MNLIGLTTGLNQSVLDGVYTMLGLSGILHEMYSSTT